MSVRRAVRGETYARWSPPIVPTISEGEVALRELRLAQWRASHRPRATRARPPRSPGTCGLRRECGRRGRSTSLRSAPSQRRGRRHRGAEASHPPRRVPQAQPRSRGATPLGPAAACSRPSRAAARWRGIGRPQEARLPSWRRRSSCSASSRSDRWRRCRLRVDTRAPRGRARHCGTWRPSPPASGGGPALRRVSSPTRRSCRSRIGRPETQSSSAAHREASAPERDSRHAARRRRTPIGTGRDGGRRCG